MMRKRIRVTGVVQGVGFRPYVFGLAARHGLAGFVENDTQGVVIEVEGVAPGIAGFLQELREDPPPLAQIDGINAWEVPVEGASAFVIQESHALAGESTPVPADVATCADCLAELFDPGNRRYRYPFLNCTNCGPRFTIIRDLPYDRPNTTMAAFLMCAACEREYHDAADRRFHAQPTACADCGPHLTFEPGGATREAALEAARAMLAAGGIVAIKGIGGFHLACDATNDEAVRELRRRKGRGGKPFAVMARDLDSVRRFALVTESDAEMLASGARPIVLLDRRGTRLSELVAPGQSRLGFFLPYSPVHHLLIGERPLVMTSGNRAEEPIVRENAEALRELATLADGFLLHDREIHVVCDDSVMHGRVPLRRSRGYAPLPVRMPFEGPSVLAVGGELKATFCLTKGPRAYLSQHIGDMENLETMHAFERSLKQMRRLFRVDPEAVVCDMHPGYLSTDWARRYAAAHELPLLQVQHHHAHAASLMAERGLAADARILTVAFDGTGYGADGAIWGGEFLRSSYGVSERIGFLKYVRLAGGDAAIRKPYRTALAHLHAAGVAWDEDLPCVRACPGQERRILERQLRHGLNAPYTSSVGRLFDAVASILGIRHAATYEAQGAIEMEALAREGSSAGLGAAGREQRVPLPLMVDPGPWVRAIVDGVRQGVAAGELAYNFHRLVADAIGQTCGTLSHSTGLRCVGLTGGVFQNALLSRLTVAGLEARGLEVLTHRVVPPNDGGLALGQAVAAASRLGLS